MSFFEDTADAFTPGSTSIDTTTRQRLRSMQSKVKRNVEEPPDVGSGSEIGSMPSAAPMSSIATDRIALSVANGEAFKTVVVGNAEVGKTRMTYVYVN